MRGIFMLSDDLAGTAERRVPLRYKSEEIK